MSVEKRNSKVGFEVDQYTVIVLLTSIYLQKLTVGFNTPAIVKTS
jgi:hypothetical protein